MKNIRISFIQSWCCCCWLVFTCCCSLVVLGFSTAPSRHTRTYGPLALRQTDDDKGSSRISDFAHFVFDKATDKVNTITGKDEWHPGDLAKWLDGKAKQRLQSVKNSTTPDEKYHYEFGDLTLWATNLAKEKGARLAGKEKAEDYHVGDITKAIVAKVQSGDYDEDDIYLALRVLLVAGCRVLPIVRFLPIQGLLSLVSVGLTKDVGGRVLKELFETLEGRIKYAVTGKQDYQFGDLTKGKLNTLVTKLTGKSEFEVGDISRSMMKQKNGKESAAQQLVDLANIVKQLEGWDTEFLKSKNATTKKV